jgi:spore germination cell wall hydrolase CwlJ-like protein
MRNKIPIKLLCIKLKSASDPTKGATHYHHFRISPSWSKSNTMIKIGKINNSKHIFYKEK